MQCRVPYRMGLIEVGCGRCKACRITRQSAWIGRLTAEGLDHTEVSFWTLTYAENPGVLIYEHIQRWVKRVRKRYPKFRYFVVGEYGEQGGRPHWHVVSFSGPPVGRGVRGDRIMSWPYGYVLAGPVEAGAYRYVAGYVLKRSVRDPIVRMSLRPGIGLRRLTLLGERAGLAAKARPFLKLPTKVTVSNRVYPLYGGGRRAFEKGFFKAGGSLMRMAPEDKVALYLRLKAEDRAAYWSENEGNRFGSRDLHLIEQERIRWEGVERRTKL